MVSSKGAFGKDFALKDQIRRACISIMSNIAEGSERGTPRDFRRFLAIAKASAGEVRSQLYIAIDLGYIDQSTFQHLYGLLNEIGGKIGSLMKYLENVEDSDVEG